MLQAALEYVRSLGFVVQDTVKWSALKDIHDALKQTMFSVVTQDVMTEMAVQCGLAVTADTSIACLKSIMMDCTPSDAVKLDRLIEVLNLQGGSCYPRFVKCMNLVSSVEDHKLEYALEWFIGSLMEHPIEGPVQVTQEQYEESVGVITQLMDMGIGGILTGTIDEWTV